MKRLIVTLVATSVFWSSATAEQSGMSSEAQFVAVFTNVCLQHLGEPTVQTVVATTSAPKFDKGTRRLDGIDEYRGPAGRLGISDKLEVCTLTQEFSGSTSLQSMQAVMAEAIGTDQGQALPDIDSRYWLIADATNREFVLSVKVSKTGKRSLATLWVQPRATLGNSKDRAN